jgi:hypothetical protein
LSFIAELCQELAETEKSKTYHLINRLIRLILTLSMFTAIIERAFSIMKVVKSKLRNKMNDEFFVNSLVVYIKREIVKSFNLDSILDDSFSLR